MSTDLSRDSLLPNWEVKMTSYEGSRKIRLVLELKQRIERNNAVRYQKICYVV